MTHQEKKTIVNKLHAMLENGFKRIEQLEQEGEYGLPHTAVREQLNGLMELMAFMKDNNPHPFTWHDWQESSKLIGEKRKTHSWIGWI